MHQQKSLIIGRFQPFHLGHLGLVKHVINQNEFALIVIGSKQKSREPQNPLNSEERQKIIEIALKSEKISKKSYQILSLDDINDNDQWVEYLRGTLPNFHKVYTGTPYVRDLFLQDGQHPLGDFPFTKNISGTLIRELIEKKDQSWQKMVHKDTIKIISQLFSAFHSYDDSNE